MKYVLIWMVSLGVSLGLASEEEVKMSMDSPSIVIIFALAIATLEIIQLLAK